MLGQVNLEAWGRLFICSLFVVAKTGKGNDHSAFANAFLDCLAFAGVRLRYYLLHACMVREGKIEKHFPRYHFGTGQAL